MQLKDSDALIVVDIQNDFLPPDGSLAVPDGDAYFVVNSIRPRSSGCPCGAF